MKILKYTPILVVLLFSSCASITVNNDFDKKNSFTLYPNPNKGDFTILFADYLASFSVNVVDQSGRIVFDKKYDTQLDLEQIQEKKNNP